MSNATTIANSQSISTAMAKGNAANLGRMRALLKDHSPKVNHHFCPPLITQADHDKTKRISRAISPKTKPDQART